MSRLRKSLLCFSATVLIAALVYLLGVAFNSSESAIDDPLVITQAGTYFFSNSCWIHSLELVETEGGVKISVARKVTPGASFGTVLPFNGTWKITASCKENTVLCVSDTEKIIFDNSNPSCFTLRGLRPGN